MNLTRREPPSPPPSTMCAGRKEARAVSESPPSERDRYIERAAEPDA
jgi:hypothetical protein